MQEWQKDADLAFRRGLRKGNLGRLFFIIDGVIGFGTNFFLGLLCLDSFLVCLLDGSFITTAICKAYA
jgi:hypothetical protein